MPRIVHPVGLRSLDRDQLSHFPQHRKISAYIVYSSEQNVSSIASLASSICNFGTEVYLCYTSRLIVLLT